MTTLRINITKKVLEATARCSKPITKNCAISYAVREIWPYAEVDCESIYPFIGDENAIEDDLWTMKFNHYQNFFIALFDTSTPAERAAMKPFFFDIEVPDEVIGEVNIEEIRRICEGSKTLELV